jgi:putative transposase
MEDATPWPHAPTHRLAASGTYFATAATYHHQHFFNTPQRLDVLQRGLLKVTAKFGWHVEAWAIFPNHYHFVAHSPESGAFTLPRIFRELHGKTTIWLNRIERNPGRKIWHNYWESKIDFPGSYLARLNYVHRNAVKHGLVKEASDYPWCSARWFEGIAETSKVRTIYGMKLTRLKIDDDYDVVKVDGFDGKTDERKAGS